MNYSAIGLMSGSSLDGLDIVWADFEESNGKWDYQIRATACSPFSASLKERLQNATSLDARSYLMLDVDFGKYCGEKVNQFLVANPAAQPIDVIGSHGHTTFHLPREHLTHQLGDGAALAATANIPVVADLRAVDVALGGQGAPIVPVGEKLLFPEYQYFLNIGGISNVSVHTDQNKVIAFDVAPANRVLNLLADRLGKQYDRGGKFAASGTVNKKLLQKLNHQPYYRQPFPKSLANSFGTDVLFPVILDSGVSPQDGLATYCEHIAGQVAASCRPFVPEGGGKLLVTGGGALNDFLISRLVALLEPLSLQVVVPDIDTVQYKEALIMAFLAVLRIRGEPNVLGSVTGAARDSCGGSLWSVK